MQSKYVGVQLLHAPSIAEVTSILTFRVRMTIVAISVRHIGYRNLNCVISRQRSICHESGIPEKCLKMGPFT